MEDFAKELGIRKQGSLKGKQLVIELEGSDEYSRMYTILDKSKLLTLQQNKTVITTDRSELVYEGDEFMVQLIGDMKNNRYEVIIEEK